MREDEEKAFLLGFRVGMVVGMFIVVSALILIQTFA